MLNYGIKLSIIGSGDQGLTVRPNAICQVKKGAAVIWKYGRPPRKVTGGGKPPAGKRLDVVIQEELVWMGSQIDVVDFIFGFICDPCVDDILGEHIPL